jgi:hypothetical protein
MTISTNWSVTGSQVSTAQVDGLSGVIVSVNWQVEVADDNYPSSSGQASGVVTLGAPDPSNFNPLSSMTRTDLLALAQAILGDAGMASAVETATTAYNAAVMAAATQPTFSFMPPAL